MFLYRSCYSLLVVIHSLYFKDSKPEKQCRFAPNSELDFVICLRRDCDSDFVIVSVFVS